MATRHVVYPGTDLGTRVEKAVDNGEYESVSGFYSEAAKQLLNSGQEAEA